MRVRYDVKVLLRIVLRRRKRMQRIVIVTSLRNTYYYELEVHGARERQEFILGHCLLIVTYFM